MIPTATRRHSIALLVTGGLLAACGSDPVTPSAAVTGRSAAGTTTGTGGSATGTTAGAGGSAAGTSGGDVTSTSSTSSGVSAAVGGATGAVSTTAMGASTTDGSSSSGASTGDATTSTGGSTSTSTATNTDGAASGGASSTSSTTSVGGQMGVEDGFAPLDPANPPELLDLSGSLSTHDPVVMEQDGTFYLFATGSGSGLNTKTSPDLRSWQNGNRLLSPNPGWISGMVSGVGNLWAPDVSYFSGSYHLYYSASVFEQNRSCIGHATAASLASGNWQDQGMIICSNVETSGDDWNAIDPNIVIDENGTPWMSFGSWWGGLKLIELDGTGARANDDLHSIAARPNNSGALEAPFIVRRGRFYYLFMSWDRCCQGTNSTYNIRVARSESVTGPYVDAEGTAAMEGGGTLVLEGDNNYRGPGHNAVLFTETEAFLIYHAYPSFGAELRISELFWDDAGWPVVAGP